MCRWIPEAEKQDRGVPYVRPTLSRTGRVVDNVLTAAIALSPCGRHIRRIGTRKWYKRCFQHVRNNLDSIC